MADNKINPMVKLGLEFGPVLAFFIAYSRLKGLTVTIGTTDYHGFVLATAGFVPLMMLCTGLLWWLTGKLSRMQVATLILVVVFGGLSVWFNSPAFLQIKVTILYALFAAVLGFGLLRGQSYLGWVMGEALEMEPEGWMILTRRIVFFFAALALANEVVRHTFSEAMWVNLKTFGLPLAIFLFFMAQSGLIQKYGRDDQAGK